VLFYYLSRSRIISNLLQRPAMFIIPYLLGIQVKLDYNLRIIIQYNDAEDRQVLLSLSTVDFAQKLIENLVVWFIVYHLLDRSLTVLNWVMEFVIRWIRGKMLNLIRIFLIF